MELFGLSKKKSSDKRTKTKNAKGTVWTQIPGIPTVTGGIKDLWEGWSTERNGRVLRDEMRMTGNAFRQGIPNIQTCADSLAIFFKRKNAFELFSAFLNGMSIVAQFVEVLQGSSALEEIGRGIHSELEAQTGLTAPKIFAEQVHKVIVHETSVIHEDGVRHFYFLYHPDTDWRGYFFNIVSRNPLPPNLLGVSENLDALCMWMIFLRQHIDKHDKKVRFHLIIPAYRPMLIKDPLIFPEKLFPLTIQGLVHNSNKYVWFNLPTLDEISAHSLELKHVGNMYRRPSEWRQAATFGTFVSSGAAWVGTVAVATSLAAPPLAPIAFLATSIPGAVGVIKATSHVEKMFEEPPPRVLGQGYTDGEDNVSVQPRTHIVSSRPRQDRDDEDRRRRHRRRHRERGRTG